MIALPKPQLALPGPAMPEVVAQKLADASLSIARIRLEYPAWVRFLLDQLVRELVLEPIRVRMHLEGVHEKIVQGTIIARTEWTPGRAVYTIRSSYVAATGFDVATMIERGRKPYVVFPVNFDFLRFKPKGSDYWVFAKKAEIPEYPAGHFVADTVTEMVPVLRREIAARTRRWITEQVRSDLDVAPTP